MEDRPIPDEWDSRFRALWTDLQRVLDRAHASTAVLLDATGNAITFAGDEPAFDLTAFASLAVADCLATREMARLLGEENLRWVVHQGERSGLVLAPLHPELYLAVLFDGRTTLGLVRHQVKKERARLEDSTRPFLQLLEHRPGADPLRRGERLDREEIIDEGLNRLFGPSA